MASVQVRRLILTCHSWDIHSFVHLEYLLVLELRVMGVSSSYTVRFLSLCCSILSGVTEAPLLFPKPSTFPHSTGVSVSQQQGGD